jgi:hypothetical protein
MTTHLSREPHRRYQCHARVSAAYRHPTRNSSARRITGLQARASDGCMAYFGKTASAIGIGGRSHEWLHTSFATRASLAWISHLPHTRRSNPSSEMP